MVAHNDISNRTLLEAVKSKNLVLGGNRNLKIYGTLKCKSGKRMLKQNRVFFTSEHEALAQGYRPCGHCMYKKYLEWKNNTRIFDSKSQSNGTVDKTCSP